MFQLLLKSRQRIGRRDIVRKPVPEQNRAAATGNARPPTVDSLNGGICRRFDPAEQSAIHYTTHISHSVHLSKSPRTLQTAASTSIFTTRMMFIYYHFLQCRSVAKNVGCFRRRLFVHLFVNTITSERVNTGRRNLGVRCIAQKSGPTSNLADMVCVGGR